MPWRMVRDASPSCETDNPAPAPTSRAVEVKGGGDDKQGWEDRGRGTVGAYGMACLRNERSSRPTMYDEQISERTAKKESNGDRQVGSLGGPESRGGRQNGRGSSRAGAHSFFTTFFGFAASVRVMMTRYAANAKQTNEPFSSHLRRPPLTQGMSSEQSRGLKDKRRGRRFKCAGWEG